MSAAVPFAGTTFGLQSEMAEVSASEYPAGLRQPRHGHDAAYFTIVLGGAYDERIGSREADVQTSALLFHPAGEEHAVQFRAPTTRVLRLVPAPAMLREGRLLGLDFSQPLARVSSTRDLLVRVAHHAQSRDAEAPLAIDTLASELLAHLSGERDLGRASTRFAERARELLDASAARVPSLTDMAAASGCHPMTLARAFRRRYGCSIGTYARRVRLRRAALLLTDGSQTISMVAAECGFSDQAHLTRELRRATGLTPGRLRRSA